MANKTQASTADESIVLPPIVANADDIGQTFEECLVYLMLAQDKYGAGDHSVFSFMVNGLDELQSYFNLRELWLAAGVEHLGEYPTLETLCAMYHNGPTFKERLMWYAAGAQINPATWDVEDSQYQEPDGDVDESDAPQISTGGERVAPDDEPSFVPIAATPAYDPESKNWYNPQTGEIVDPPSEGQHGEIVDDDPLGVNDMDDWSTGEFDGEGSETVSFDDNALDPPSWLSQGTWDADAPLDAPLKAVNSGDSAQEEADAGATTNQVLKTFVCGFTDEVARPVKPVTKEQWKDYVAQLKERYEIVQNGKLAFIEAVNPVIVELREKWKRERDNKLWNA